MFGFCNAKRDCICVMSDFGQSLYKSIGDCWSCGRSAIWSKLIFFISVSKSSLMLKLLHNNQFDSSAHNAIIFSSIHSVVISFYEPFKVEFGCFFWFYIWHWNYSLFVWIEHFLLYAMLQMRWAWKLFVNILSNYGRRHANENSFDALNFQPFKCVHLFSCV